MREIVLDTETTGFDPETGDRIVEIGAVELENLLPTGRVYHQYINPDRAMPIIICFCTKKKPMMIGRMASVEAAISWL